MEKGGGEGMKWSFRECGFCLCDKDGGVGEGGGRG